MHGCRHTFESRATTEFPRRFAELLVALDQGQPIGLVVQGKSMIPAVPGCYVISTESCPVYVGIARNLRRRIPDHLSSDPSRANLAVRIATQHLGVDTARVRRAVGFDDAFHHAREQLAVAEVAWMAVPNALEFYLFEPYVAMRLDTSELNRFDTLQILAPRDVRPSGGKKPEHASQGLG